MSDALQDVCVPAQRVSEPHAKYPQRERADFVSGAWGGSHYSRYGRSACVLTMLGELLHASQPPAFRSDDTTDPRGRDAYTPITSVIA
jgi:hypothetical protein